MNPEMKDSEQNQAAKQQPVDEQLDNMFEEFDLDDIEVIESKVFA
ncbi:3-thiaglutamate biosynthesis pearlin carrier peptide TglA [Xenorhabdus santafensis]|nr:TglA family RiPP precursor [Xenorhabdus sp. 12]